MTAPKTHHGVCERCLNRLPLCLYRSSVPGSVVCWHAKPIQPFAVVLCGPCALTKGFPRWFESAAAVRAMNATP